MLSASSANQLISYDACAAIFEKALRRLLVQDVKLFADNVSERAICGAFSHHLRDCSREAGLSGYYVDVEYNRNRGMVKTVYSGNGESIPINCDLIVHSRGLKKNDNIIAVEMKKGYRSQKEKQKDKARLRELTKNRNRQVYSNNSKKLPKTVSDYVLGVYLEWNRKPGIMIIQYYSGSELVSEYEEMLVGI